MPVASMNTQSGGSIDFTPIVSPIHGNFLSIHVDQTANVSNGEDEVSIMLTLDECKRLIAHINEYIEFVDGKNFVVLSDSVVDILSNPVVQAALEEARKKLNK